MYPSKYIGGLPFGLNSNGLFNMPLSSGIYGLGSLNGVSDIYGNRINSKNKINYYAKDLKQQENTNLQNVQNSQPKDNFTPTSPEAKTLNLQLVFENAKNEQGIIGKAFDKIKGFTGVGISSKKCRKYIDALKEGKVSYEEANSVVSQYSSKQKTTLNIFSGILTAGLTMLALKKGKDAAKVKNIISGMGIGAFVNSTLHVTDRMTNNIRNDVFEPKEVAKDAASGALIGAAGGILKK